MFAINRTVINNCLKYFFTDDHDVQKFLTFSLHEDQSSGQVTDTQQAEQQKFDQEFQRYQEDLDKKKEE